jgi:hypothetical protein
MAHVVVYLYLYLIWQAATDKYNVEFENRSQQCFSIFGTEDCHIAIYSFGYIAIVFRLETVLSSSYQSFCAVLTCCLRMNDHVFLPFFTQSGSTTQPSSNVLVLGSTLYCTP